MGLSSDSIELYDDIFKYLIEFSIVWMEVIMITIVTATFIK